MATSSMQSSNETFQTICSNVQTANKSLRRRSSSAAICQFKDVCRQKDLQQLWRQMLCCCRSKAVEQSASSSETNWH